ncbi:MAG TPA: glutamine synthetase family protein [Rhodocyclaceae bacterium]|nr:glutamine synthetase [Rhodocyclaceae bacterium]HMV52586.1 glutamine synthetase family protein [Rhodocyclaceae bacterium]HNA04691.1 glutamine synthetase family protein [Rhodocyclaceae bacterium]HNH12451.1 glutamine synthetase family protein [Rhodocyclaceae bacterium]HNH99633.1 glutamine synthetase family protein [Rhodocyclaceae bacterium]
MSLRENFSHNDMERWLDEHRVTEIECLVPDLTGVPRGKILPREKFTEDRGMRLPEAVVGMTVTGDCPDDSEDYDSVISVNDRDMLLLPDPGTVRLVPWAVDPTAQVIHDCYFSNGHLVDFAPRSVLRHVLDLYKQKGWKPVVAPELEFYLIAKNTDPDQPLRPPKGRSGRAETSRQAYSIDAVNEFDPLFEQIYDYCAAQELDLDTLIHEMGAGQMEINFVHGEPLGLADKCFFFKRTLRETALRHDMYATFMAKPMAGEPGSAMHIHQSVVDTKTGQNIFSNPDGSASKNFHYYIGGLQKYMPAAMALVAPYVNSYRRIVRHTAAPINIQWGKDNRTVGFRIPHSDGNNRRVENRVVGADANPYLAFAATLACGYLGIQEQIEPRPEITDSAYDRDYELPRSLSEALSWLRETPALHGVLGERFIKVYSSVKELEYSEFMKVISPWEREHLLLHV